MKFKALQMKRQFIIGKTVVGIDPAKNKHQAVVLDPTGVQLCKSFSFQNTIEGYTRLWDKIKQQEVECNQELVFAIETSCNLWQNLAYYLHRQGYKVLLVSPLTTNRSRPFLNHDFSRTDPKDAHLMASNTRDGYFDYYQDFSSPIKAMHQYSITYDKLRKNLVQNKTRLRALIDRVFPEFVKVVDLDTHTAKYLLTKYFLPQHFFEMDIELETKNIEKISQRQHGKETLERLQKFAEQSVGIMLEEEEILSFRLTLDSWLILIETIKTRMDKLMEELITLAKQTRYYEILTSLKGVSDKLAALFIAETRDLGQFTHYKKLEKYAGYNLRQSQSGQTIGPRHMSHIGNKRLSWVLYKMTEETAKYVPEVRMKFIRRQIKRTNYRKNLIASSSILLKLITSLVKENRTYENCSEGINKLDFLEHQYMGLKKKNKAKYEKVA